MSANRKAASTWYRCQLAGEAEACYLAGPRGPLSRSDPLLGGFIEHLGNGEVRFDESALTALRLLPAHEDGRITWEGEVPVMQFGRDTAEVLPER